MEKLKHGLCFSKLLEALHLLGDPQEPELCSFQACTPPSHVHHGPLQTPVGLLTCDPMHPFQPHLHDSNSIFTEIKHYSMQWT